MLAWTWVKRSRASGSVSDDDAMPAGRLRDDTGTTGSRDTTDSTGAAPAKSAPAVLAHPLRVSSEPAACPPTDQLGNRRVPWPAPRPVFGDFGSVVQVQ